MKISACINTFNEESNIKELIENLKDCDEIIIGDDSSTDKTQEIAKSMGAKVYVRSDWRSIPTIGEVTEFENKFGYKPQFTTEDKIFNSSKARNETLFKAKNDWVYFPDADERVTWDFKAITKLTDEYDSIKCNFNHGSMKFDICKLFKKSQYKWEGMVHEVVVGNGKEILTDKMNIEHLKKECKQGAVLKTLEYSVLKTNQGRDKFYLAREYLYKKEFQKAIDMYLNYLQTATWLPEMAEANLYIAKCCWVLNRGDESRKYCLEAIRINPDYKEALMDMANYYYEPNKSKWLKIAQNATNQDVLFVNK